MHKCPSALHRNSMEVTPRDKPVRSSQLREGIKRYASSDDSDNDESDQVPACRPSLPAAPSAYRTPRRCKRCEACVDTHTVMHAGHMHATTKCRLTRQRAVLLRWTPGSAMMYRTACEECGAVGYIPMAWFLGMLGSEAVLTAVAGFSRARWGCNAALSRCTHAVGVWVVSYRMRAGPPRPPRSPRGRLRWMLPQRRSTKSTRTRYETPARPALESAPA